ncbi:nucleoside deaminase [Bacillus sp. FJAT-50079]|uniref:nucleoside deaminase n=1 Tax=Bacillus sp. FJAT-50079 TaxID=2833577 RepID=UPI001BC9B270|nr:nucleoside deaminase [Bacillus sp. FJAT-50079]MBS4206915.1 nucleoside deaminase [Bacillus sp. FJAT-50079]
MDVFMKRAVELAVNNVKEGGQPFGAVLVKNGEIVAEGVNELHLKHDVSGHAELLAIRRAQEKHEIDNLQGYTLYASGEPCPMCMTAIYFSGIEKVYYCAAVEEAKAVGLGKSAMIYEELALPKEQRNVEMIQMPLEDPMENPMDMWKE